MFILIENEAIQRAHKCVKPILPRAKFGAFVKEKNTGELKFTGMDQDDEFDGGESGYITPANGDSGSAYQKLVTVRRLLRKETRWVVVALHSLTYRENENEPRGVFINDRYRQCRNMGSKITTEVTEWIKKKAGII